MEKRGVFSKRKNCEISNDSDHCLQVNKVSDKVSEKKGSTPTEKEGY